MPKMVGIEFIYSYVKTAYLENLFCSYFAADDIHHLFCGYEEEYHELFINIYEPVLTAALSCCIAGTDMRILDITENGQVYIIGLFSQMENTEILITLQKAADELNRIFRFPHELTRYIKNSLPLIQVKIKIAAEQNTLRQIFYTPSFPENNPKIIFSYGYKMDDEQYRKIIEEIRQCRYAEVKIAIIKESIGSFADLEDVFLDAELTEKEILSVLYELGLPQIAVLSKKYQPMSDESAFELKEQEQLLRMSLQNYISELPQREQSFIEQASKAMQEEGHGYS